MPKGSETESMKRVLMQIAQLCKDFDGNSLKGLLEPEEEALEENPLDPAAGTPLEGEDDGMESDPSGDMAKLLALKKNGG